MHSHQNCFANSHEIALDAQSCLLSYLLWLVIFLLDGRTLILLQYSLCSGFVLLLSECTSCLWKSPPASNFSINQEVQNLNGMSIVTSRPLETSFLFSSLFLSLPVTPSILVDFIALFGMIKKNVRILQDLACCLNFKVSKKESTFYLFSRKTPALCI